MKRFVIVLAGVLLLCGVAAGNIRREATDKIEHQRQENVDVIRGKITKINKKKKEIVIKVNKTGEDKTFSANSKILKGLKVNKEVRVKLRPGTQVITSIIVVKKHQEARKNNKGGQE